LIFTLNHAETNINSQRVIASIHSYNDEALQTSFASSYFLKFSYGSLCNIPFGPFVSGDKNKKLPARFTSMDKVQRKATAQIQVLIFYSLLL
jgi:hypothetical protein